MIAPERLLSMSSLDALKAQVQEVLVPPLKSTHLYFSTPVSAGGTATSVSVTIDKSRAPVELWDRIGVETFTYPRLDLAEFTEGLSLIVKSSLPADARAVLNAAFEPYSIPIGDSDVVPAFYTAFGSSVILAAEKSYRWVGEVNCFIDMLGIEITPLILVSQFTPPFNATFRSSEIKQLLLNYLNVSNASSLPETIQPNMLTFGNPEVNGPIMERNNTRIQLMFRGIPFIGNLYIYYMRRGFEDTFRWPKKVSGPVKNNMTDLAGVLSNQMGCTITAADITSGTFPAIDIGQSLKFPVFINPSSLAYVGSIMVEYTRTS